VCDGHPQFGCWLTQQEKQDENRNLRATDDSRNPWRACALCGMNIDEASCTIVALFEQD
jgi:hypothetical protein